jgi:hypothetical protein
MVKSEIFKPQINGTFKKFLDEYDYTISFLFNNLKKFKPDIIDSYCYSEENPPKNRNYKYPDKLFLACILYISLYQRDWKHFLGPIPGKQVNARHLLYLKFGFYREFFEVATEKTISEFEKKHKNTVKYISTDTTVNNNKLCKDLSKHYPCNKNRKGAKVSFLVNNHGIVLSVLVNESSMHDSRFAIKHIDEFFSRKKIIKLVRKHKNKLVFLADSAYDCAEIKNKLCELGIRFIIKPNNRATKDASKKRYLKKYEKKQYNYRIKIEHSFGTFKRPPKINCVYERKIKSYEGIVLLIAGMMNLKKLANVMNFKKIS